MLLAIDLTPRQVSRVLEQALRSQARLDLETRAESAGDVLGAKLIERRGNLLAVQFERQHAACAPICLVGAYCDVRMTLGEELYLFTTCVMDVDESGSSPMLLVAIPEQIQVANRRRFVRTNATVAAQVRITFAPNEPAHAGLMVSISATGLAADMAGLATADRALLGEPVRVWFELPGAGEPFELPAVVCNKQVFEQQNKVQIGLEFAPEATRATDQKVTERLRTVLAEMTVNLAESDGEP